MDNDNDSPSQVQSAVDVDSNNNIVVKKQLQFVTVEYSHSNGGDYLELHTATLSEYNQQPDVNDSSVFEPVEISFDFEVTNICVSSTSTFESFFFNLCM